MGQNVVDFDADEELKPTVVRLRGKEYTARLLSAEEAFAWAKRLEQMGDADTGLVTMREFIADIGLPVDEMMTLTPKALFKFAFGFFERHFPQQ